MSKWAYYLSSIPTLLGGVKNWGSMARLLFPRADSAPVLVVLHNGCRFKVRSFMDLWIIKETCLDHFYDEDRLAIVEDWIVLDIGAGLGDFSIQVACHHPLARIYAFEPFAESARLLEENLALNRVSNVRCFPYAIGARTGPMNLETASGIAVQHSTAAAGTGQTMIQVQGMSLDDVFSSLGLACCDLLKVDCEGGEYDIFFHASGETLNRISHICMEYHDQMPSHSHPELVSFLESHGFQVRIRPNPVYSHLGYLNADRLR